MTRLRIANVNYFELSAFTHKLNHFLCLENYDLRFTTKFVEVVCVRSFQDDKLNRKNPLNLLNLSANPSPQYNHKEIR